MKPLTHPFNKRINQCYQRKWKMFMKWPNFDFLQNVVTIKKFFWGNNDCNFFCYYITKCDCCGVRRKIRRQNNYCLTSIFSSNCVRIKNEWRWTWNWCRLRRRGGVWRFLQAFIRIWVRKYFLKLCFLEIDSH